jgi:hypothetical protein
MPTTMVRAEVVGGEQAMAVVEVPVAADFCVDDDAVFGGQVLVGQAHVLGWCGGAHAGDLGGDGGLAFGLGLCRRGSAAADHFGECARARPRRGFVDGCGCSCRCRCLV